jgi:hypothetical protein
LVVIVVVIAVLIDGAVTGSAPHHPLSAAAHARRGATKSRVARKATESSPALPLAGIPVGKWVRLADGPTSRGEVSAARIGDSVYVVGGFDAGGRTSAVVQRLNLRSGRWSASPPMPEALNHMNAIGYGGDLYVVGGYSSLGDASTGAVRGFWRFVPATGHWSAMPDAPLARAAAGAAVLGHRLYVAGGRSDTVPAISTLAIFDFDTGRWSLGPPLADAREHVAAVAADGAVWVLGGRVLGAGSFATVERYRPGASSWETLPSMPVARSGFQAVAGDGGIVAVGGEDGTTMVGEVERLDLATGRWGQLASLSVTRHGLGLVVDGPRVYAIDGGPGPGLTTSAVVERLRLS